MSVVNGLVPFDGGVAPALSYVVGLLVDGADVREGHEDFPYLLRDVRQRVGEPYLVGPHDGQARELLRCDVGNEECHFLLVCNYHTVLAEGHCDLVHDDHPRLGAGQLSRADAVDDSVGSEVEELQR